jgi:magnesium transporter
MFKFIKKASIKAGLPPGSVVHIGRKKVEKVKLELIDYTEEKIIEKELKKVEESFPFKDLPTVTWLNVTGLHDTSIIEKIGQKFDLHPLVQEDIVNTGLRPAFDDFDAYFFVSLKMLYYKEDEINAEHVSLIVGKNFVISFQETEGDVFDTVRQRLRTSKGKFRKSSSDYLAYALIDAIVDHYFIVLEKLGSRIESIEEEIESEVNHSTLTDIHTIKRELIYLKKSVWPLREVLSKIKKSDSELINEKTFLYFGDVYDHTIQIIDTIESYRDVVSGIVDIHLSLASNRMNEIMKVLTIFAAIFIPLTFIVGIYGMNFEYMPELSHKSGYFFVWAVFIAVAAAMLLYFKRKKWI